MNAGEIPGNGIDDDGNGFVDDEHGYNFLDDNGDHISMMIIVHHIMIIIV